MWFREENIKISENLLIFPNEFGIITNGVWRDVRAGRRSMIGNHVYGNHRTRGSNPLLSAKVAPVAYASGVCFLFAFLGNVMKRVLVLLIIISLLLCTVTASAASSVSFRTSDCETARNRVFTVNVCAASGSPLCAALFDITYDSSAFDFRGASVQKPALVETNSEDGRVRLDYLNAGGTDCSEEAVIFTLSFKSKKAGTYTFGYTVSQCVDSDAEFMSVGEVRSGVITVTGSGSSTQSKSSNSSKSSSSGSGNSKSSSSGKSKSGSSGKTENTTEATVHDYGSFYDFTDHDSSNVNLVAVAVLCAVSMALSAAAVLGILKVRSVIKRRKADANDDKSKSDE